MLRGKVALLFFTFQVSYIMKTRQLITLTGIVAFSGGVIFPAQAEELTETSRNSEDEMVITASGFSQQKREAPATISVIDRKTLDIQPDRNVGKP